MGAVSVQREREGNPGGGGGLAEESARGLGMELAGVEPHTRSPCTTPTQTPSPGIPSPGSMGHSHGAPPPCVLRTIRSSRLGLGLGLVHSPNSSVP